MADLMQADLRAELGKIKSRTLVMVTWIGYKEYGAEHAGIEASLHDQYAKLANGTLTVSDTARHFIMWDDPNWMFEQMDHFLAPAKSASAQ
jgi:hypothetical protein